MRSRHLVARAAAASAVCTVVAGATVVSAGSPAAAAPPASAVVCFAFGDGTPYTGPVYARTSGPNGWRAMPPARSMSGCTLWTVESGYAYRFFAYATGNRTVVEGSSPWTPMYYPGRYDAGTWIVTEHWF